MPVSIPPRRLKQQSESFRLKSALVASALFFGALVPANQEFYFSGPAQSLSETEVALRLKTH